MNRGRDAGFAFAAAYPEIAGPIVLVGCGTWNIHARAQLIAVLEKRINDNPPLRSAIDQLPQQYPDDPRQQMVRRYELTHHLYDFDPLPEQPDPDIPPFDETAHNETWRDMLRLQEAGRYPAAFAAIRSPVLMLHGSYDPHPGAITRDALLKHISHLEYHELPRCGHSPWRERSARTNFSPRYAGGLPPAEMMRDRFPAVVQKKVTRLNRPGHLQFLHRFSDKPILPPGGADARQQAGHGEQGHRPRLRH